MMSVTEKKYLSRESEDNCFNKSVKQMKNIFLLLNKKQKKKLFQIH